MKKLYVGNVPFQATDEELTAWFSAAGVTASSVTLVRDRATGQPRGFGFVEIQSDEDADKARANAEAARPSSPKHPDDHLAEAEGQKHAATPAPPAAPAKAPEQADA